MYLAVQLYFLLAGLLALSQGLLHSEYNSEGLTNCSLQGVPSKGERSPSLKIAPGNSEFALRLYHLIGSRTPGKNIFLSPLSVSAALAMLSLGARSRSHTQILEGLGFHFSEIREADVHRGFQHLLCTLNLPSNKPEIHVGTTLFLMQGLPLLPQFLKDAMALYKAQLFPTNFHDAEGATQLINDHVKKETRGRIENLVSGLSTDMVMVLVNYIYFKALWKKPFRPSMTTLQNFYIDDKTTLQVPMMVQDSEHWYLQDRYLPCSVLRMDYEGDAVALFILPNKGKIEQIKNVFTPGMIIRWKNLFQKRSYFYRKLELHFPKFSISASYELDQLLPKLGFTDIFSQRANLSGITQHLNLKVSKSFHKATLDVDEAGTQAAATSNFSVKVMSAKKNSRVVRFNRPFFVVLMSTTTQSILFLGKVVNPMEP
ncbi:kallistatin [Tamandua tetradactyla]|uniref:kallistatin n=1 Tax=Tamandua tetradactyla TaxID=48850 RepID=UPI0040542E46